MLKLEEQKYNTKKTIYLKEDLIKAVFVENCKDGSGSIRIVYNDINIDLDFMDEVEKNKYLNQILPAFSEKVDNSMVDIITKYENTKKEREEIKKKENSITQLNMKNRYTQLLIRRGIGDIDTLSEMSYKELMRVRGIGSGNLAIICSAMIKNGYSFKDDTLNTIGKDTIGKTNIN